MTCLPACLNAYAQNPGYTGDSVRLDTALQSASRQGRYSLYLTVGKEILGRRIKKPVWKDLSPKTLKTSFDEALKGFPVSFSIEHNTFILTPADPSPPAATMAPPLITIHGMVTDGKGHPVPQVNVLIKGTRKGVASDSSGQYRLPGVEMGAILRYSQVSMQTVEIRVNNRTEINIRMDSSEEELNAVVNTGYQKMILGRAAGSIDLIPNTLFNRTVSSNWSDRLENLSPGLLYNHGGQTADGASIPDPILIHGRSTIYANPAPLVVLDNFPYDGDLTNINPNDIENVSILKDAAATAIWGARAGNGVIVLTTKKGKLLTPQVVFDNNITWTQRPDLSRIHTISSPDYIDFEKNLYDSGYYGFSPSGYTPVTPVVALLQAAYTGVLSRPDANTQIETLKRFNVLDDMRRYLYRNTINHRHYLQVSGGSTYNRYFFSGGWDQDPSILVGTQYNRYTLRMQNTYTPKNSPFQLETSVNYTASLQQNGHNPGYSFLKTAGDKDFYPYAQLADAQGNPLPVNLYHSPSFLQQTAQMGFLNWAYSPLADLPLEKNTLSTNDLLANAGFRYSPLPSLNLDIKYQFERQTLTQKDLHTDSSYYARDLINSFTQPGPNSTHPTRIIPAGAILDRTDQTLLSHQLRIQASYHHILNDWHEISAIGGYEIKSLVNSGSSNRYYDYDPVNKSWNPNIDYAHPYLLYGGGEQNIPAAPPFTETTDHFISYFSNASYTYHKLYTLSGSAREDMTNLFGVKTNQKGVPLWSLGAAWNMNNEEFFPDGLSFLKLRTSYGVSGNVSRLTSAYTTALYSTGGISGTPYTIANIQNPANENLRWEQVKTFTIGADFANRDTLVSGTIEYYHKNAGALLTQMAADPTLGLIRSPNSGNYYFGNSAAMKGKGIDLQLEIRPLRGKFRWTVNGIYSYSSSIISSLTAPVGLGNTYLNPTAINAVKGKPVFGVYSYAWKGLDANGNPTGILNGKTSIQWDSIYSYTTPADMVYNGPAQPTSFGALRNTFAWRRIGLSFNISYKFGYYFRKPSLSYSDLADNWNSSSDYTRRWRSPGDEKNTHVPSAPANYFTAAARDEFYKNSSVLIDKADNIRLEDLRLEYGLSRSAKNRLPFANVLVYATVTNIALLWKANKDGIDPYYINTPGDGRRWSLGATIHF